MIRWDNPTKKPIRNGAGGPAGGFHYLQESVDPKGYVINMVPYGDASHLEAMFIDADDRCTFIGRHANLRGKPARNEAARDLRAACEKHAARIAGQDRSDPDTSPP